MSSEFHHGEGVHDGYILVNEEYLKKNHLEEARNAEGDPLYTEGKIYTAGTDGLPDVTTAVYDFSLTKNVVQLFIALIVLVWIMTGIAKSYAKGDGVKTAPAGLQNAIEPVIAFIRDEVGKPNLGHKYEKFMPYLLTVFFFILINNFFGLILLLSSN